MMLATTERLPSRGMSPLHSQPAIPNAVPQLSLDVMDYLPVGICVVDAELQIRVFNLTARRQLDIPDRLFAEGMPNFADLILFNAQRGEYGAGESCDLARVIVEKARLMEPHHLERKRPNGTVLDIRGEPLPDGGFVTIWTDITARSLAEAKLAERNCELEFTNVELSSTQRQLVQAEKMASIGQLAAGVAHEINNPIGFVASNLGSIEGYANDLLKIALAARKAVAIMPEGAERWSLAAMLDAADPEWLAQDIPPLLAESRDGIERVKRIVQDLKDFSRPESSDAQWQIADMVRCIRSTTSIARNEIKYCADVEDQLPDHLEVECFPSSLNQVFLNLLVNAAHAIEAKGAARGKITLRAGSHRDRAWFEFQDNGCGMTEKTADRIFDPFFTTKPVGKGTGLGLSIAHGIIVEKHAGSIKVSSTPGEGTTFRIEVPLRQNAAAEH